MNRKKETEDTEFENLTGLKTEDCQSQDEKIITPSFDENVQQCEDIVQWSKPYKKGLCDSWMCDEENENIYQEMERLWQGERVWICEC